tara:strand:+ start:2037 stop:2708 length:672 start_codon:yes stop_codon:yes gene_type:complete
MAKKYFRHVPDFNYVSRSEDKKNINDYQLTKNLFKRVKIREEIFNDLSYFTKYKIVGDDRPDNVAYEVYGSSDYDWVVMLANNILNVESEWPLSQESFYKYMIRKYSSEPNFYNVHHYETIEVKDSLGRIIIREGFQVPENYNVSYYDSGLDAQVSTTKVTKAYTNYEYETEKQDNLRNIFLIKREFLGIVIENIEDLMPYKEGSTQYRADNLVQGDNIRLYT